MYVTRTTIVCTMYGISKMGASLHGKQYLSFKKALYITLYSTRTYKKIFFYFLKAKK